nr:tetratricopeptide repeat protein [Cupriavidus sp. YR651]
MRLRKAPDDPDGWYMLARSYGALERFDDAAAAYAKAVALVPDAAALRADYADALASASGGSLEGAPLEQIRQALALDPDEPKALALAGSAAAERGDLKEAIRYWEHLYRLLPSDSLTAMRVAANLAAAQSAMESAGQPTSAQAVTGPAKRPGTQPVSQSVSQSGSQSANQSANQSAARSAPQPAPQSDAQAVAQPSPDGPGLPRPQ